MNVVPCVASNSKGDHELMCSYYSVVYIFFSATGYFKSSVRTLDYKII